MALLWDRFDKHAQVAMEQSIKRRSFEAFEALRVAQAEYHAISGMADMYDKMVDPHGMYTNTWRAGLRAKGAILFEAERMFADMCIGGSVLTHYPLRRLTH